jgi:hypothetical protein
MYSSQQGTVKPQLQGTDLAEILVVVERLNPCQMRDPQGFSEAVGRLESPFRVIFAGALACPPCPA